MNCPMNLTAPAFASLLLLPWSPTPGPVPDLIGPDDKVIAAESRLDIGDLADEVCTQVVAKKGDSLATIARQWLGDAARAPEIEKLNPGLPADQPLDGRRLWLPPRKPAKAPVKEPAKEGAEPRFAFVGCMRPRKVEGEGLRVDEPWQQKTLLFTVEVWLVSPAQRPQLEAILAAGDLEKLREFEGTKGVVHLEQRAAKPIVPRSCPATRRVDVYRVDPGTNRGIVTASSELFDAAGKSVPSPYPGEGKRRREGALLLLLAGLGGGGLWRRRRRGDASPA
jgi:hypothetical protein